MIIYGEVLFLENFITGWVILMLTGRLRGCRPGKWRIAAGSAMCGLYAFIIFVHVHWFIAIVSKLLFSAAVVILVFDAKTLRNVLKTAGVFYMVSFLMGGTTIAIMYMLKIPGMTGNGSFMFKGAAFLQLAAGVTVTWYLGRWLAGLLREKYIRNKLIQPVTVELGGCCWHFLGLIDTGNSLKDPVMGWPVAVLSKDTADKIRRECDSEQEAKLVAIPYRTAGGAGVMFGLRPDSLTVGRQKITEIILGFGNRNFSPWQGSEKYDILLHQQFLEGEEKDYGKKYDDGQDSRGIRKSSV